MSGRVATSLCLLLAFLFGGETTGQEPNQAIENQVKAAFIYNFTKFVNWPEGTFENLRDPIRIGVLEDIPLMEHLSEVVEDKTVRGHPLEVERVETAEGLSIYHVVFIGAAPTGVLADTLSRLREEPILVVGESPGFASQGGVINFVAKDGRMQLEINAEAAARRSLHINSRLLNLATVVSDGDEG